VLLTEYAALGTVAALAGLVLAAAASAGVVAGTLDLRFSLDVPALLGVWAGVTGLTVGMGFLMSLPVLRRPPLAVLREIAE
jgi:putative ABC transport system permease protein